MRPKNEDINFDVYRFKIDEKSDQKVDFDGIFQPFSPAFGDWKCDSTICSIVKAD